ncbi:hypothetical protein M426DRAFT_268686 [Hypoxylon sp. CI-4A]|nr:hypothetical protein M426DRAFT_268686 [Hypoxylon sp. CI-4A]
MLFLYSLFPLLALGYHYDPKPAISPPFDFLGAVEKGLQDHMPQPPQFSITLWDGENADKIPYYCKDSAMGHATNISKIQVFKVAYADCEEPWVMCRHQDAKPDVNAIAVTFGRLPIGMREYVNNILVLKAAKTMGFYSWSQNGSIGVSDESWSLFALAKEISNQLDSRVSIPGVTPNQTGGLSNTGVWRDSFVKSDAMVSSYANSSMQENLALSGALALFNVVVPGGVGTIQPNWTQIVRQYGLFQTYYGNIITPGVKLNCTQRLENTPTAHRDNKDLEAPSPPLHEGLQAIPTGVYDGRMFSLLGDSVHRALPVEDGN